jgi:hypothetical protein
MIFSYKKAPNLGMQRYKLFLYQNVYKKHLSNALNSRKLWIFQTEKKKGRTNFRGKP